MNILSFSGRALVVGAALLGTSGCMMDDDPPAVQTAEAAFVARAKAKWAYSFRIDGEGASVWVDDTVEIDKNKHDISADVYADEAKTIRLFRLDMKAAMTVIDRSTSPDAFNVDIRATAATFTAFVDDPALWAALGVEDCKLVVNQPVDVMASNCLYPLTRNTTCAEHELYEIAEGSNELRAGTPVADHCGTKPTVIDRQRAPYLRR